MGDDRTLDELIGEVTREGHALTSFLNSNSFYQPSFRIGGFKEYPELPGEVQESRRKLREAAKAVHDLAAGPVEYVKDLSWVVHNLLPL